MIKKVLLLLVLFCFLFSGMAGQCFADALAQLEQAKTYKRQGYYEQAAAICKTIVTDYPGTDDALMAQNGLVLLYILMEKSAEAQTALDKLSADFSTHPDLPKVLYGVARRYRWSMKYEDAKSLYQQIIQQFPDNQYAGKAQLGVARINVLSLFESGQDAEARAAFDKLVVDFSGHPDLPEMLYGVARRYRWSGKYGDAKSLYQQITQQYPDNPYAGRAQLGIARINVLSLFESGKTAEAQAGVDKLTTDFSGHSDLPETLYYIADKYEGLEKYEEAKSLYQQITQQRLDSPYAGRAQLGAARTNVLFLIESKRAAEAKTAIDKLTADFSGHPDLPEALYYIAGRYGWSGKYEQAKNTYQQVIQQYPDSQYAGKAQLGAARVNVLSLIESGNNAEAKTAIDKLTADFSGHPDLPEVLYGIARRYRWSRKYEDAKSMYQQITQQYPDSRYAGKAQLGAARTNVLSLIASGNNTEAQAALDKLTADFSGHSALPKTLYYIAKIYEELKKYEEAKSLYQGVVTDYPGTDYALKAQLDVSRANVLSLIKLGNDAAAQTALDSLIADFNDNPDLPAAVFVTGEQYYNEAFRMGNEDLDEQAKAYFRKTIAVWERVIQESPASALYTAHAYYFSGYCYHRLGEYEKAIEYYQKVVDNWPDYEYAWHAQLRVARCYERLAGLGRILTSDAAVQIRQACEKLLANYPDSEGVKAASDLLKRWENL